MNSTAMNTFLNSSVFIFTLFQLLPSLSSESEQVRVALVRFMSRISVGEIPRMVNFGWNITSDPCADKWQGISCDSNFHVRKIVLDHFNLTGVLDAASLCSPHTLTVLSLNHNSVVGVLPEDISNCTRLTHLFLLGNNFSGSLPTTLPRLSSLKRLVISDNAFSGEVPVEMTTISGLLTFLADNNRLTGEIPSFNFSKLAEFNVSYNNFSGPIPDTSGSNFSSSSFLGNTRLCGEVISKPCPSPPLQPKTQKNISFLIFLGYVALGVVVILLAAFISIKRCNPKKSRRKESSSSENSITTPENESDSSFEILSSPVMNKELKFDDLLGAPAELLGKGKHGSAYKVTVVDSGVKFVVKRIRGWDIPKQDFKNRMLRINAVQHPNVLRLVAFYCSTQEKLLVYEYQHNGSLFSLLHGMSLCVCMYIDKVLQKLRTQEQSLSHMLCSDCRIQKRAAIWLGKPVRHCSQDRSSTGLHARVPTPRSNLTWKPEIHKHSNEQENGSMHQ